MGKLADALALFAHLEMEQVPRRECVASVPAFRAFLLFWIVLDCFECVLGI